MTVRSSNPGQQTLADSTNPDIQLVTFADAIPGPVYDQMKSRYADFPNLTQDPHLWLSPQLAEYYLPYVAQQLSKADPENATDYQNNAAAFEKRLKKTRLRLQGRVFELHHQDVPELARLP